MGHGILIPVCINSISKEHMLRARGMRPYEKKLPVGQAELGEPTKSQFRVQQSHDIYGKTIFLDGPIYIDAKPSILCRSRSDAERFSDSNFFLRATSIMILSYQIHCDGWGRFRLYKPLSAQVKTSLTPASKSSMILCTEDCDLLACTSGENIETGAKLT